MLALETIALDRMWPAASAKDRESGASGSTFGQFRRLGVGARQEGAATDRRPLDRDVERHLGREGCSGMIQHTHNKHIHSLPAIRGVRNGMSVTDLRKLRMYTLPPPGAPGLRGRASLIRIKQVVAGSRLFRGHPRPPLHAPCPRHPASLPETAPYAFYMRLCFYVIPSFLPSLPAGCRDADLPIKSPPG